MGICLVSYENFNTSRVKNEFENVGKEMTAILSDLNMLNICLWTEKSFQIVLDRLLLNMESTHVSSCKLESLLWGWFRKKVNDSAMNQHREDAFE